MGDASLVYLGESGLPQDRVHLYYRLRCTLTTYIYREVNGSLRPSLGQFDTALSFDIGTRFGSGYLSSWEGFTQFNPCMVFTIKIRFVIVKVSFSRTLKKVH